MSSVVSGGMEAAVEWTEESIAAFPLELDEPIVEFKRKMNKQKETRKLQNKRDGSRPALPEMGTCCNASCSPAV